MGLLTKQDIDNFYNNFKNEEVVFTKTITNLFGVQPKHINIKFKEIQRPCIIYSSSMSQAKVIVSLTPEFLAKFENETSINLRFAFTNKDKKNDIIYFFILCRTTDIKSYKPEQNLFIIQFEYINKPPESLIILLGRLLEAKKNSSERSEERIIVDKSNFSKFGFNNTAIQITIDSIPRQAIIRDLSFGGMNLLLVGNAKFLINKAIKIDIPHKDYNNLILLGKSIRAESLANRKDIVALAIKFDLKQIPVQYNLVISEYIKSQKIINKIKTNIEAKELEENKK